MEVIYQDIYLSPQQDGSFLPLPQHGLSSPPQPQVPLSMSLPLSAAEIIAFAQPTPLSTLIAPTGQLSAQAPHSMHDEGEIRSAAFSPGVKTPWGQTVLHIPQLMHRSSL